MGHNELRLSQIPTIKTAMQTRHPPAEVFTASAEPDGTATFWFTNNNGRFVPGEMYGGGEEVHVKEPEEDRRVPIDCGESGFAGTGEELLARVAQSPWPRSWSSAGHRWEGANHDVVCGHVPL